MTPKYIPRPDGRTFSRAAVLAVACAASVSAVGLSGCKKPADAVDSAAVQMPVSAQPQDLTSAANDQQPANSSPQPAASPVSNSGANPLIGLWHEGPGCAAEFTADSFGDLCGGFSGQTDNQVSYVLKGDKIEMKWATGQIDLIDVTDNDTISFETGATAGHSFKRCNLPTLKACSEASGQ